MAEVFSFLALLCIVVFGAIAAIMGLAILFVAIMAPIAALVGLAKKLN